MNPRQTILCKLDVFAALAEILEGSNLPIIDGGANVGETAASIRKHFPDAPIHLFEPVSRCHAALADRAASMGNAKAYHCALGAAPGQATMHINKNLWTCSLLPANERGQEIHGDWCDTIDTETVDVIRLDDWAKQQRITEVSILKLDLQGAELPALQGCIKLLKHTRAVYCEAQIIAEYEGASTFAEIDLFMRQAGFGLYQIADLCMKGKHAEPSCCDGLWLRNDVLQRVRAAREPAAIARLYNTSQSHMADALALCKARNLNRIAIYGGGDHTARSGSVLAYPPVEIAAIIDDAPKHTAMWGIPIVNRSQALELPIDAIVLSSDTAEPTLIERAAPFIAQGIPVIALYASDKPILLSDSQSAAA